MYVEEQRSRGRKINCQRDKKGTFYILHIQIKRYILFKHIILDTYVKLGK